jgi:predicted ArsR family transcriptional regulator
VYLHVTVELTVMERVTVAEAAQRLGITPNAVRQRISRGNMQYEKDEDGRVYVYLDANEQVRKHFGDSSRDELVDELRSRVQYLERELQVREEEARRKDHLLAAALERIPAIEPPPDNPSEPGESPRTASEEPSHAQAPPEEERRSWWQRLFGV